MHNKNLQLTMILTLALTVVDNNTSQL